MTKRGDVPWTGEREDDHMTEPQYDAADMAKIGEYDSLRAEIGRLRHIAWRLQAENERLLVRQQCNASCELDCEKTCEVLRLRADNARLRSDVDFHLDTVGRLTTEKQQAADEIERLRDEIKNMQIVGHEKIERLRADNERLTAALLKVRDWYRINGGGAPTYTDTFPVDVVRRALEGK